MIWERFGDFPKMSVESRPSFADPEGLPSAQSEVADDLHAFLVQFFALFPEYRENEFYPFGESYGGRYVPTIGRRIHEMNQVSERKINLRGLGIGNGWIAPEDSGLYAEFLYQVRQTERRKLGISTPLINIPGGPSRWKG